MGLFYERCLVVEIYEDTCFCEKFLTGELVQVVSCHGNSGIRQPAPKVICCPCPPSSQLENRGLMFLYQFMGGVIIICLAILFCGTLFLCLWMIPVMALFYATGLKW